MWRKLYGAWDRGIKIYFCKVFFAVMLEKILTSHLPGLWWLILLLFLYVVKYRTSHLDGPGAQLFSAVLVC